MEVVGNDSASVYVLRPFDLRLFQFRKSEIELKSDERERELKSSKKRNRGNQVDIQTAELQVNLWFKYETSVAEFGVVGNADYDKAVTKKLTTGTRF